MSVVVLPGAVWRPVSYRSAAGPMPHVDVHGWVLHVVVGNGSPFHTFEDAPAGHRRFSHAWVGKDGSGEQYQDLAMKSWAQVEGNGTWWSIETEGFPDEPLTAAQITTLARWHNYLHAPDRLAGHPTEDGIGTHFMGGAAWGGHSCPDPVGREGHGPRSIQRQAVITKAIQLRAAVPLPRPTPKPTPVPSPHPVPVPVHHPRFVLHRDLYLTHPFMTGEDVVQCQHTVGAQPDGVFGAHTAAAVEVWQGMHHLVRDGHVGPATAGSFGWVFA